MELVGRILDGSIPYSPRGEPKGPSFFGGRISQDDKIDRLEEVGLLAGCSRRQLRAIARISDVVEVPADTVLARSGQAGEEFFLILDGSARVEVSPRKRSRLEPGEYFGEMSLLDGGPRSASVVAETPLRLLVIKRRDFTTLLREAPELTQSILATLSRRVRVAEASLTTD
jgi:CRP-like cAMP-binding protein